MCISTTYITHAITIIICMRFILIYITINRCCSIALEYRIYRTVFSIKHGICIGSQCLIPSHIFTWRTIQQICNLTACKSSIVLYCTTCNGCISTLRAYYSCIIGIAIWNSTTRCTIIFLTVTNYTAPAVSIFCNAFTNRRTNRITIADCTAVITSCNTTCNIAISCNGMSYGITVCDSTTTYYLTCNRTGSCITCTTHSIFVIHHTEVFNCTAYRTKKSIRICSTRFTCYGKIWNSMTFTIKCSAVSCVGCFGWMIWYCLTNRRPIHTCHINICV